MRLFKHGYSQITCRPAEGNVDAIGVFGAGIDTSVRSSVPCFLGLVIIFLLTLGSCQRSELSSRLLHDLYRTAVCQYQPLVVCGSRDRLTSMVKFFPLDMTTVLSEPGQETAVDEEPCEDEV